MSPELRLGIVLRRLATITSIKRSREEEHVRAQNHGGDPSVLDERMLDLVSRLELVADELEQSIA